MGIEKGWDYNTAVDPIFSTNKKYPYYIAISDETDNIILWYQRIRGTKLLKFMKERDNEFLHKFNEFEVGTKALASLMDIAALKILLTGFGYGKGKYSASLIYLQGNEKTVSQVFYI